MNLQVKTSLIIGTTLVIGILLGVVIDRTVIQHHLQQRFVGMRHPKGLIFMFEQIIEPDESQRDKMRKIINKHSERLFEIGEQSRAQMAAAMDSLHKDLNSILIDEQKARLEEQLERIRSWRPMGPPPPFEGPMRRPPFRRHDSDSIR